MLNIGYEPRMSEPSMEPEHLLVASSNRMLNRLSLDGKAIPKGHFLKGYSCVLKK